MAPKKLKSGIFTGPFDQEFFKALVDKQEGLKERRDKISLKMNEMVDGDDRIVNMAEYEPLAMEHRRLTSELDTAKDDVQAYALRQPFKVHTARAQHAEAAIALKEFLAAKQSSRDVLASEGFEKYRDEEGIPNVIGGGECFKIEMPSFNDQMDAIANSGVTSLEHFVALQNAATSIRSDNASGQEVVDDYIVPGIIERLKDFGSIAQWCHQFMTSTGGDFVVPQADNTGQMGVTLANQGAEIADLQPANFGKVTFKMNTVTSGVVKIANEMIQDAVFDTPSWVDSNLVRRIGRRTNYSATQGEANTDWESLKSVAKLGKTTASNQTVAYTELVDLIHSIDPAYRMGGEMGEGGFRDTLPTGAGMANGRKGFMLHDDLIKMLMKMTDGDSRPLWVPSTIEGQPNKILGWDYIVNNDLDTMAANAIPALFGNFYHYWLRTAATILIYRFNDSQPTISNETWCLAITRRTARHAGPFVNNLNEAIAQLKLAP